MIFQSVRRKRYTGTVQTDVNQIITVVTNKYKELKSGEVAILRTVATTCDRYIMFIPGDQLVISVAE